MDITLFSDLEQRIGDADDMESFVALDAQLDGLAADHPIPVAWLRESIELRLGPVAGSILLRLSPPDAAEAARDVTGAVEDALGDGSPLDEIGLGLRVEGVGEGLDEQMIEQTLERVREAIEREEQMAQGHPPLAEMAALPGFMETARLIEDEIRGVVPGASPTLATAIAGLYGLGEPAEIVAHVETAAGSIPPLPLAEMSRLRQAARERLRALRLAEAQAEIIDHRRRARSMGLPFDEVRSMARSRHRRQFPLYVRSMLETLHEHREDLRDISEQEDDVRASSFARIRETLNEKMSAYGAIEDLLGSLPQLDPPDESPPSRPSR